jgi:LysM repeat protein
MSKTRTRTLVLGGLLALALMLPACTRSASTPPAEEGAPSSPLDSQQATMEAVRAALLTQTAQAEQAAPAATEVPTQVVAPQETEEPGAEATAGPTAAVEYVEYTVKPGDWLFMIADNFGVDPQAIVDWPPIRKSSPAWCSRSRPAPDRPPRRPPAAPPQPAARPIS